MAVGSGPGLKSSNVRGTRRHGHGTAAGFITRTRGPAAIVRLSRSGAFNRAGEEECVPVKNATLAASESETANLGFDVM
jgi:hypothetical protein